MRNNPNWIRTIFASFMLAILLRVGLAIPFLTTFITLGIIYVMHVVLTEMGPGAETAWAWTKLAGNVGIGIVIFIALRFIGAQVVGLYPIDTYRALDSGGLYGILPAHDVSKAVAFEILFAFVAGGLSVAWVKGKRGVVGAIFGISLAIVVLQAATPKYAATWPNRDQVSTNLINHGLVGAPLKGVWVAAFGTPEVKTNRASTNPATTPVHTPVWSEKTLKIPPGGFSVTLYRGWRVHPLGGNITITTPSGRVLHDEPGSNHDFGWCPKGNYIFLADPPGSERSVDIYNQW